MNTENVLIRFDWAAKRILRQKANFGVLEGLVTVLLGFPIHIVEILESEGNQEYDSDKFNRVDIKARTDNDEIIIVEIQITREAAFLQRILYGVSKAITEHISLGDDYKQVKKIYSISILYFDLGKGDDYVYHGQTSFKGLHTNDELQITDPERNALGVRPANEVFPEFYLIRVNQFNQLATTPLEEWIQYLKSGVIKDNSTAPGLAQAKETLKYLSLSPSERRAYERHLDSVNYENDALDTARKEGIEEGRKEGRKEATLQVAKNMLQQGLDISIIAAATGLPEDEIRSL